MIRVRSTIGIRTIAFALAVLLLSTGCGNIGQQIENASMDNLETQAEPSDTAIREYFVESGLGEGDEFLEELKRVPRERVIRIVREIKEKGIRDGDKDFGREFADERLRIKAAYFLATLGDDVSVNEEFLVRMAGSKELSIRIEAIDYIAPRVGAGRKDLLSLLFAEAQSANGHLAEGLTYFFVDEAESATEPFLTCLAKEPKATRIAVFKLIAKSNDSNDPDATARAREKVAVFRDHPKLKAIVVEFLANVPSAKTTP